LKDGTYTITSTFGYRKPMDTSKGTTSSEHKGIDLGTYGGAAEPIFAVADGTVARVGSDPDGYGYYVYLDHDGGVRTVYAHMIEKSQLIEGNPISAGEQIGNVGSTGNSTGPHLHFEIIVGGDKVDPTPYIEHGGPTYLSASYTPGSNLNLEDVLLEDIHKSYHSVVDAGGTTVGQRVSGATPQPVHAFVNIYVGDNQTLLATNPARPNFIQSFEYSRLDGAGESVIFTVFDDNWQEMEKVLAANYNNIYIEYGYYGIGVKSKRVKLMLLNYSLSFEDTGTILSVEAVTEGVVDNLTQTSIVLDTYNPTEAVKKICEYLGYTVLDENFDESQDVQADNPFNIIEDFPITYIYDTIIPQASQVGEELFSFDIDSEGVAYFKREGYSTTRTDNLRTYIVRKGYDSSVIDFTVDIKGVFGGSGTFEIATEYRSSVFDTKTKNQEYYEVNKGDTITTATGDIVHTKFDQSSVLVEQSGYTPSQTKSRVYYDMKSMIHDGYSATLTILGDPTIQIHDFVRVINMTDSGHLHHTSGVYWIQGITDSIQGGSMTTTLKLLKNATAGDIDGLEILHSKPILK